MHDPSRARVHEHALELVVEPHPRRPAEHGTGLEEQDDELGLADRDRAGRASPLGLAGGLVGAQRRTDVERQALVDRAGHAQGRAVLAHLLDELRAEHAHAGDPLVEAQVAAAREVGVVLGAGRARERRCAPARRSRAPRAWLSGKGGVAGALSVATSVCPATRKRRPVSSRAGTAWRGGFTSGNYRRRPRERSSLAPTLQWSPRFEHEASRALGRDRWRRRSGRTASSGATARRRRTPGSSTGCSPTGRSTGSTPEKAPGSYLHRSHPSDVARTEHLTFIASRTREDAGPTNNWMSPEEARQRVWPLFDGAMKGRTMYVVPYVMGPLGSPFSQVGVEITDSPYVVANMRIMTRMGRAALDQLGRRRGLRARAPLARATSRPSAASSCTSRRSARSGASARATAATRCSARSASRCASPATMARDQGWMAEHMLILELELPGGRGPLHRRRLPLRLRQDEPRHARLAARGPRATRCGRSATTSPGCGPAPTAGSGRSTPRPASSASCRAPGPRRTRTRWPRSRTTRSSRTWR